MLQPVKLNGFVYFADVKNQVLYTDESKKSGAPFSFLTANEKQQIETELRFPRVEVEY